MNTILASDGTIYFTQDNSVIALAHTDFSTNVILLTALLLFDLAVVTVYPTKYLLRNSKRKG